MLRHLSLDVICSWQLTVFLELRSRKTVRFSEQIMSADKYLSIFFAPNGDYCLFIHVFERIWKMSGAKMSLSLYHRRSGYGHLRTWRGGGGGALPKKKTHFPRGGLYKGGLKRPQSGVFVFFSGKEGPCPRSTPPPSPKVSVRLWLPAMIVAFKAFIFHKTCSNYIISISTSI